MSKTIGIIGGMGPEATLDLFRKIIAFTPASKDQEHIHVIIDSYAQIPDRTASILHGGEDPSPYLKKSAQLLEKAGADVLIMPCNTAHHFAKAFTGEVKIPFLSIVDAAIAELKVIAPNAKTVLPIATVGTKAAKVYENSLLAAGYTVCELPENLSANVMSAIYDGVKKGRTEELLPLFQQTLDEIGKIIQPDVMIAACTEIPILMESAKTMIPMVDATSALARAAVNFALDK